MAHSTYPKPRRRSRVRIILFRIFYSTSFTLTLLILLGLMVATSVDTLYESYRRNRLVDIFVIGGIYVLTALIAAFMYASRLYSTRSVLKDIPKTFIPVDKSDLPSNKVWRLIEDCKSRSAVVAYLARPRVRQREKETERARRRVQEVLRPERENGKDGEGIFEPQWGRIEHRGWSSPANTESGMAGLEYARLVGELCDLVEARAVSLAPQQVNEDGRQAEVEEWIIEALRRPEEYGMRQYVTQLVELEMLDDNSLTSAFLTMYERARFSPAPMSDEEFRTLMRMFAEILRAMKTPDIDKIDTGEEEYSSLSEDESSSAGSTRRNKGSLVAKKGVRGQIQKSTIHDEPITPPGASISGSIVHNNINTSRSQRTSLASGRSYSATEYNDANSHQHSHHDHEELDWTAPTSRPPFMSSPSAENSMQHRKGNQVSSLRASTGRLRSTFSRASLRSNHSNKSRRSIASGTNGSVIRLRMNDADYDDSRDLPYEIRRTSLEGND